MTRKSRLPDSVSVRLKPSERKAINRHADAQDMTASALGRKYFLEGLKRDGVLVTEE